MDRLNASVARQSALLNLGLWTAAFGMFMGPAALVSRADGRMMIYTLGTVLMGLLFCSGLYLLISRTRAMSKGPQIALIGAVMLCAVVLHAWLDALWTAQLYGGVYPDSGQRMRTGFMTFTNTLVLCPIYVINVAGVTLAFFSRTLRERERSLAAAREMAQEAQLAALRFQINPHFLFNTLNAVASLIGSGRNDEAEAVVVRLSEFFRASLVAPPSAQVALTEEFDLIGSYLDIESARFGPRLLFDIDCPEALRNALVPHFLLQPLVENAIKYGVAPTKRPVTITLRAFLRDDALVIRVSDDGEAGDCATAPGAGVGLNNVAGRLAALFGETGKLTTTRDDKGFTAEVELPFNIDKTWKAAA